MLHCVGMKPVGLDAQFTLRYPHSDHLGRHKLESIQYGCYLHSVALPAIPAL